MIRLKRWFLIGCAVLAPAVVKGGDYQGNCCAGGISVGADFIYWKPCLNDLDYALAISGDLGIESQGSYHCLDHGYEPGLRVFAYADDAFCGWGAWGNYTYFWAKTNETSVLAEGENLLSTLATGEFNLGTASEIQAKHSLRYQTFDALLYHEYECFGPSQLLIPYFGISGLKLDQTLASHAISNITPDHSVDLRWDSEYRGLGLKLGTEYRTALPCNLQWFFSGSFTILAGVDEADYTLENREEQEAVRFTFKDRENMCQPGLHLASGLRYDLHLCGKVLKLHAGYEFLNWWNVPKIRRLNVSGEDLFLDPSTLSNGSNLTLHGLFAGLELGF
jgi:hypothetical protein